MGISSDFLLKFVYSTTKFLTPDHLY